MVIATYICGSCAVAGIQGIGDYKSPEEVLKLLCQQELGKIDGKFKVEYSKLTTYYIFCAGPEVKSTEKGGSHHSKDHWPKYGTEFAKFLVDNKLGEVVTVGPKFNAKHHPTTTAQVWAWSPDQKAVEEWWTNVQKGKK